MVWMVWNAHRDKSALTGSRSVVGWRKREGGKEPTNSRYTHEMAHVSRHTRERMCVSVCK